MSGARERLAAALVSFGIDYAQEATDALLPVVQALVAEGQAEALEAAAGWAHHGFINSRNDEGEQWASWLRDRAAALRGATEATT